MIAHVLLIADLLDLLCFPAWVFVSYLWMRDLSRRCADHDKRLGNHWRELDQTIERVAKLEGKP